MVPRVTTQRRREGGVSTEEGKRRIVEAPEVFNPEGRFSRKPTTTLREGRDDPRRRSGSSARRLISPS